MNPGNNIIGQPIRNSYGYQDQSGFRVAIVPKTYNQYNGSYQDKKLSIN